MEKKKKKIRKRFFRHRELRFSIALMILWSLLAMAFLTYLTRVLGGKIEPGLFFFIIVFAGYAVVVVFLTLFFTHRFVGPFERLKMEMRIILSGDYQRRLCVRNNDDVYIRSFISDVNRVLDELERMQLVKEEIHANIDSELLEIVSLLENRDVSREELRDAVIAFHERLNALFKEQNR
ncbi:MAG: hypothetical protein VST71_12670 [Nitrospirota bacterium]|nr:hypothetical protein [Nitrospirota bacterium]